MRLKSDDSGYNISLVYNLSQSCFPDNLILSKLAACQAILESRLNRIPPSELALSYCNLFGMKPGREINTTGTAGVIDLPTYEYINGETVLVHSEFLKNNDVEDSLKQYKILMGLSRYENVRIANTIEDAAQGLVDGGYATDPNYKTLIVDTYNQYIKERV